jgi:hypothetical protein
MSHSCLDDADKVQLLHFCTSALSCRSFRELDILFERGVSTRMFASTYVDPNDRA